MSNKNPATRLSLLYFFCLGILRSNIMDIYLPYGGNTSVTLVLWAFLPVHKLTREGQQIAVVQ